jgi:hypothetical protein
MIKQADGSTADHSLTSVMLVNGSTTMSGIWKQAGRQGTVRWFDDQRLGA